MKPASVGRFPRGLFLLFLFVVLLPLSLAQPVASPVAPRSPPPLPPHCGSAFPAYLGGYRSDGTFRPARPVLCHKEGLPSSRSDPPPEPGLRPREVPPFIDLHALERVIESYQPPAHAKKAEKRRLAIAALRDEIVTFVYGREKALLAPEHLTVDSQGRVIVSDPGVGAVHVLDGRQSFRIVAGANRRLHVPAGVAVDANDNIYVSDPDRGVVVVFDRLGTFLRDIGKIGDETLFHSPTRIAIDSAHGRLYLLDTGRDVLFVTDLEGNILMRVGRGRGHPIGKYAGAIIPIDLDAPTEIAISKDKVVLLDSGASRIRVLDLQCNVLGQFNIRAFTGRESGSGIGLGLDAADNLYVSNVADSRVRIYDLSGHLKDSFGQPGSGGGEFNAPSALWIDLTNRLYVADTNNRRIQMFQLAPSSNNP